VYITVNDDVITVVGMWAFLGILVVDYVIITCIE
jgi:hypothetical protein